MKLLRCPNYNLTLLDLIVLLRIMADLISDGTPLMTISNKGTGTFELKYLECYSQSIKLLIEGW